MPHKAANVNILPGIKLRYTLRGHKDNIRRIAWSPDGRMLASASDDQTIHLWDAESGELRRVLDGHSDAVFSVAWSGRILASGSNDRTIRLWDTATGRLRRTIDWHTGSVYSVAWSGETLASGSKDNTIRIWRATNIELLGDAPRRPLKEHFGTINSVAWSPDGRILASGSSDKTVRLWDISTTLLTNTVIGTLRSTLEKHSGAVYSVAWSPDGRILASGSSDKTVRLWDPNTGREMFVLEGHTEQITCICFSAKGHLLASKSWDGTVRLWRCDVWEPAAVLEEPSAKRYWAGLAFHPSAPVLATLGEEERAIHIWDLDLDVLLKAALVAPSIHHVNAKVVLVGESGVGKSGLGIRIAEDRFRPTESTHGANFWPFTLPPNATGKAVDPNVQCQLTLCDLAGQPEYRLVHQLFLDDTDVALLLFDCPDPTDPFRGVPYWAKVLKRHAPAHALKYLVSSRCDVSTVSVDQPQINNFLSQYGLHSHFRTSAKTGEGVAELMHQVVRNIPWGKLTRTTTTRLFQAVREYLSKQKQAGKVLIEVSKVRCGSSMYYTESADIREESDILIRSLYNSAANAQVGESVDTLTKRVLEQIPWERMRHTDRLDVSMIVRDFVLGCKRRSLATMPMDQIRQKIRESYIIQPKIYTVIELLQAQGLAYRLYPTPRLSLVLLKPELLNQYASSVIQAARKHPRGIGAVPERDVVTSDLPLTGVERLKSGEEKILLESTVELLIRHGLCFREMGFLVFPSQINVARPAAAKEHPPTEVTYQFSGSIEAIYASLVVRLNYTSYFQREDQWRYAVEFSRGEHRLGFAMRQVEEGTGELEIYFFPGISEFDRVTFIRFITEHLRIRGIDIQERIRLYCPQCSKEVQNQDAIETRVREAKLDIPCQYCSASILIPRSIEERYRSDRAYPKIQQELIETVEERTKQEVKEFHIDHRQYTSQEPDHLIHILHLSDLHLETESEALKYRTQLETDLIKELQVSKLECLILSGDIVSHSTPDEYKVAFSMVDGLVKRFGLDPDRVIVVPGNHDLNWGLSKEAYRFIFKDDLPDSLPEGWHIPAGDAGALVRDKDLYRKRFAHFGQFYKKVYGGLEYPLDYAKQYILRECPKDRILFLALNSAWQIDHHYKERSGIHMEALAHALSQLADDRYNDWLKIAIWHHPVTGPEIMKNVDFLEQLAVNGFQICMHGHIHEAKQGFYTYDPNRGLHIIGAGTFGAPTREQVPGIPLQYNLLTLDPETRTITVETRKKEKPDGAWMADARWGDRGHNPEPRYTIKLKAWRPT